MVSKKLNLLFTLCMLVSAISFAQTTPSTSGTGYMNGGYSIYDSSVIPSKRMGQQNEFWNNSYSFPSKPRNMWEVGISTGIATISGDVSAKPLTAPNFGIHVRKSFGYIFSLRLQYINTINKGQNWKASENFSKNPAWINNGYFAPYRTGAGPLTYISSVNGVALQPQNSGDPIYYNYKTNIQDLSLQGIFTVNNIRFHKAKTGIIIYGGGGIGGTLFETKVNALDANNKPYTGLFAAVAKAYATGDLYANRKTILNALKNGYGGFAGMDDTYETPAESERVPGSATQGIRPGSGAKTFKPSGTVLAGVAFKLGKRINLAIEDRWTFVKTDLLDGQQWQEHATGDPVLTRDFDSYNYASIGLNFNLGGKSVEPLYWLNPLDYAYSELNTPKHMKLPKQQCEDTDGDGVCDFLDKEPNTPAGCPVDTHGVTRDTDGDGVPDCKDKQLITPTECQPVDADGVGKCPVKCCTTDVVKPIATCPTQYPSLTFKGNTCTLSSDNKALLSSVASKLKDNPTCSVTITGYTGTSKAMQALGNCRKDAILKELSEKNNIGADRVTYNTEVTEDAKLVNTVDIKSN